MRSVPALVAVAVLAGCGSSEESSPPESESAASALTTEDNRVAVETTEGESAAASTKPGAAAIRKAEQAAEADKPDAPYWKGAKYAGYASGPGKVCVDQVIKDPIGGNPNSHVIVSMPGYAVGEAQEGLCAKREQTADKAIVRERRYFLKMDDLAVQLDDAVSTFQDGGSAARIGQLRNRILDAVNDHLLAGGDTSIGGNLLLSAATTARDEAQKGDPLSPRLADQHNEIADARNKLADEAIG